MSDAMDLSPSNVPQQLSDTQILRALQLAPSTDLAHTQHRALLAGASINPLLLSLQGGMSNEGNIYPSGQRSTAPIQSMSQANTTMPHTQLNQASLLGLMPNGTQTFNNQAQNNNNNTQVTPPITTSSAVAGQNVLVPRKHRIKLIQIVN